MNIEEAILLLEHTGYDDFNLLEHQIKGRLEAIKVILKENQELKVQINEAIENSNKLLKFINQNFMSNDGFKQFSFKDLLEIKGYCEEVLEILIDDES